MHLYILRNTYFSLYTFFSRYIPPTLSLSHKVRRSSSFVLHSPHISIYCRLHNPVRIHSNFLFAPFPLTLFLSSLSTTARYIIHISSEAEHDLSRLCPYAVVRFVVYMHSRAHTYVYTYLASICTRVRINFAV